MYLNDNFINTDDKCRKLEEKAKIYTELAKDLLNSDLPLKSKEIQGVIDLMISATDALLESNKEKYNTVNQLIGKSA